MNFWDIIILCCVIALVILAIRLYRGKRKTGGCCGGSGTSVRDGSNSTGSSDRILNSSMECCTGNCSACVKARQDERRRRKPDNREKAEYRTKEDECPITVKKQNIERKKTNVR